jgi:hypothetical protein
MGLMAEQEASAKHRKRKQKKTLRLKVMNNPLGARNSKIAIIILLSGRGIVKWE